VINKTVSKDDLVRTVTTAYANGWQQVKLYFMCGLPTETDEDVLEIAELAVEVIRAGRQASGARTSAARSPSAASCPSRTHPSSGPGRPVPRRSTPAEAPPAGHQRRPPHRPLDRPALPRRQARRGRGLLSRGDRRVGRVIERVWREGGRFDGWSEHFSYERWTAAAARSWHPRRRPGLVHHPRARPGRGPALGPPGLRAGQGVALGRLAGGAVRRRRSPTAGGPPATTAASARPTAPRSRSGRPGAACSRSRWSAASGPPARRAAPAAHGQKLRLRYAKRGPLRFASHRDLARALERALRRRGCPWPSPPASRRTRRSPTSARPPPGGQRGRVPGDRPGAAAATPSRCAPRWTPRCPRASTSSSAWRPPRGPGRWPTGSTPPAWRVELPGVSPAELARRSRRSWPPRWSPSRSAPRTASGTSTRGPPWPARRRPRRQVVPYCTWSSGR
jgi:hypothetical protein